MTADSHWDTRWDVVTRMTRGRYRVPAVRPVDPTPVPRRHTPTVTSAAPSRLHNADMLQAQLFVELLDDELADLQLQMAGATRRVRADKQGADKHLGMLERRIDEVIRLLDALALNFPTA